MWEWGAVVLWAYSSPISLLTAPRVDGSHPGSSSFFVGDTRQLETKTFSSTNDVERENAKTRERQIGEEKPAGERGMVTRNALVRLSKLIKW